MKGTRASRQICGLHRSLAAELAKVIERNQPLATLDGWQIVRSPGRTARKPDGMPTASRPMRRPWALTRSRKFQEIEAASASGAADEIERLAQMALNDYRELIESMRQRREALQR